MSEKTPPHCYRHPDRETWVTCSRCERPICPACMTEAPVGFHCPVCVAESKRTVRGKRTVFGGSVSGSEGTVTKALIGINIGVWLLSIVIGIFSGELTGNNIVRYITYGGTTDFVQWTAAVPVQVYTDGQHLFYRNGIATGEFWRLITAGFMHYGILHIALNMFALWILGNPCEQLLGRWRYLALYLLAGIGGATAEFLFRDPGTYAVGASGSVFGLMAALVIFHRKLNLDLRPIITLLVLNLMLGLFIPGVSVIGHVGGALAGAAVGVALAYGPQFTAHENAIGVQSGSAAATRAQIIGICAVAAGLIIAITIRVMQYGLL